MKFKVPAIVAAAGLGIAIPLLTAAAPPADVFAEEEARLEVELAETAFDFEEQLAVYEACTDRVGLSEDGVWVAWEETRETRSDTFDCQSEAWPEWYDDKPTPLAPPADWEPDAAKIAYQSDLTDHLSAVFTAEGVEHTIVTEDNGARWIDYDDLDPVAASTVAEIISRGDHYVDGGDANEPPSE